MNLLKKLKGLFMADVTSHGKERITNNDGTMRIGVTDRKLVLNKPDIPALGSDNQDKILNDQQNVFKVYLKGSLNVNIPLINFSTAAILNHNLGYVPGVIAWVSSPNAPSNFFLVPYTIFGSGLMTARVNIGATTSDITFEVEVISGSSYIGDWIFNYYILQETAN